MYRIGLSTCNKVINDALFRDYAENGITEAEISQAGYADFDYRNAKKLSDRYGVRLWSLHLPFFPFSEIDISAPDDALRKGTVSLLSEIMKKGAEIGIRRFIIHPSGEPNAESDVPEKMRCAKESLAALADVAEKQGAVLCVEDLPLTCLGHSIAQMHELLSADDRLRVCFDTNHITVEKPEDVIRALGDKIITLHVSDFDFCNERHWLPGEGKIDWPAVLAALSAISYQGPWLYEIGFTCPKTILRDRALTCRDFAENAKALFAGTPTPVLSRPKPNLGMWE